MAMHVVPRLMAKPSWEDAPEWANWLYLTIDGTWWWCGSAKDDPPVADMESDSWKWVTASRFLPAYHWKNWEHTLEGRPIVPTCEVPE